MTALPFDRIILIAGMPRSGTTWLSAIIAASPLVRLRMCPPFCYDFKDAVDHHSARADWDRMLAGAWASSHPYLTHTDHIARGLFPDFKEADGGARILAVKFDRYLDLVPHMLKLYAADELSAVFIIRDPRGAIHSWLTAPKEFPPDADPLQNWRSGAVKKSGPGDFFGFDDWCKTSGMFTELAQQMPARAAILPYERLVAKPLDAALTLYQHLGLNMSDRLENFLDASTSGHSTETYGVFKAPSVSTRWREQLDPRISRAIEGALAGTSLERFLI